MLRDHARHAVGGKESMINDTNRRIAVTLTKPQLEALEAHSRRTGLSKSVIVKLALESYLKGTQEPQKGE